MDVSLDAARLSFLRIEAQCRLGQALQLLNPKPSAISRTISPSGVTSITASSVKIS